MKSVAGVNMLLTTALLISSIRTVPVSIAHVGRINAPVVWALELVRLACALKVWQVQRHRHRYMLRSDSMLDAD